MANTELTVVQALAELVGELTPISGTEIVALAEAAGRVLDLELISPLDLPAFDNSAMDGYALRADDLRQGHWLHELGRAYAGHGFAGRVETGNSAPVSRTRRECSSR